MSTQEEINHRSIALGVRTAQLTGRVLVRAMRVYMTRLKLPHHRSVRHGKQSVKSLARQGQGMASLDMSDSDIRLFDRTMRKYGVDYAVMKEKGGAPPMHTVFFKGRDADAVTKAFADFTAKVTKKQHRPSVLAELRALAARTPTLSDKLKHQRREHSL